MLPPADPWGGRSAAVMAVSAALHIFYPTCVGAGAVASVVAAAAADAHVVLICAEDG